MHSSRSKAVSPKGDSLTRVMCVSKAEQGSENLKMQEGTPVSPLGSPGCCPSRLRPFLLKKPRMTQTFSLPALH